MPMDTLRDKNILKDINNFDLEQVLDNIKNNNIESIAINLIFSYLNPKNEFILKRF